MRAVVVPCHGGPEVLELREVPDPRPAPADVLVAVEAIGVNYHDALARSGALAAEPPFIAGVEAAGTVLETGTEVTDLVPGQRIVWPFTEGSYAELAAIPARWGVPVPDEVSSEQAAALVAQGLTAHYLSFDTYAVRPGDDVLVHAAAGGVGRLLVQLATHRGGRVIATTSSDAKADFVRDAGAAEVVGYENLPAKIRELTGGKGVEVVYDGVGAATFEASLAAVARRGHLVCYGATSGPVPPFEIRRLSRAGSPYLSRPSLIDYVVSRADLLARADQVFELAARGVIQVPVTGRFGLDEAQTAQQLLDDRTRVGKLIIFPQGVPQTATETATALAAEAR
ncbi:quinone oxidoreductase [Streptomyces sp. NPDC047081]|uniref:quinone oxidoreductase family protein n=1 Tax=Streptomyces sp. NPDC047081 TaxID=3154706 RepID=UPI0033F11922